VAQIGAWELTPDAGSIHFSPQSCELFGLPGNTSTNLYPLWLSLIDPRDRRGIYCPAARKDGRPGSAHPGSRWRRAGTGHGAGGGQGR
jgi:hypothetical protein